MSRFGLDNLTASHKKEAPKWEYLEREIPIVVVQLEEPLPIGSLYHEILFRWIVGGCGTFDVYVDPEDPRTIVIFKQFPFSSVSTEMVAEVIGDFPLKPSPKITRVVALYGLRAEGFTELLNRITAQPKATENVF
jgi:hypothetical protein